MSDLKIVTQNDKLVADSRDVAEMVGKRHDHLLRDIKNYMEVIGKTNFGVTNFFIESYYTDSQNKPRIHYFLTKKGCDMVANKMTGEKGVLFTAAYVIKFEEMEKKLNQPLHSYMIDNPAERARLWAQEFEERESQRLEKEKAQKQLSEQRPKVLFAESVQASENTVLVRELARMLFQKGINIGERRLFGWLRTNGYLIKQRGESFNLPTQRSMELKLFEIHKRTLTDPDGDIRVTRTPKVTGKGQVYFLNKLLNEKAVI